jgi:hypothetical protein
MTTALQCIISIKPYILAGFEPGIFCSVGERDDHYATPPGQLCPVYSKLRRDLNPRPLFIGQHGSRIKVYGVLTSF